MPVANKEILTHYGILVLAIASFGGLLFGYHTAVISGALVFLTPAFDLSLSQEGMIVSIMLLGGLAGAFLAGYLSDRLGKKNDAHFGLSVHCRLHHYCHGF